MHEVAPDLGQYLHLGREELFSKLADCVTSLCTCLFELGFHEAEETRGKARSYQTSTASSANQRYQDAAVVVAQDAATISELKATRDVLQLERDFLLRLIDKYASHARNS